MNKTPDGNKWWVQIDSLDPNTEYAYQFLVDGTLKVADPYSEKVLDPNNDGYISSTLYPGLKAYPAGQTSGIVSTMQANKPVYTWKNNNFVRPEKNNLVIYELLIRDFTTEHSYASTLQKLDYLTNLGINAIELMPVNEFEGNSSWGYNPSFYFAPDK
jgi:1,4-alpha-glucan branching enzyme